MTMVFDTQSPDFERVRQDNPVVYNLMEKLYRDELSEDQAFATLAVMLHEQLEQTRGELKNTLEQSRTPSVVPTVVFEEDQEVKHVDYGDHYGIGTVIGISKSKKRVHVHFPKIFLFGYYTPDKLVLVKEVE